MTSRKNGNTILLNNFRDPYVFAHKFQLLNTVTISNKRLYVIWDTELIFGHFKLARDH